ncbi:hypothetical protein GPECTOR_133g609 [Gonium pectorale]|uniref:Uncharacterized protein n=1 Tax=Gonium pectorale TaxID=33097 RepID=A0A150FZS5_GONPE|nr:hypothetical protein GPECTOR_133g609 [Gonium pectorale]|eukprot:KXZ42570.1 hypothetical protein GPECTOR_133g609 [Gonium pectorale]
MVKSKLHLPGEYPRAITLALPMLLQMVPNDNGGDEDLSSDLLESDGNSGYKPQYHGELAA